MENQINEVQAVSKCLSSNTSFTKIHPQSKIWNGCDQNDLIKLENLKWGPKPTSDPEKILKKSPKISVEMVDHCCRISSRCHDRRWATIDHIVTEDLLLPINTDH
eukprot:TRINITY_DN17283_c0_g2_i1.p1 TRINITY_DN17283_c0_g2~~TRINITY_DN17283_c0_g2_i1.p1  ORF type:complete len:105 (+),score=12.26 TRINITY_DN17283_c0_g2_i1:323-637(+)